MIAPLLPMQAIAALQVMDDAGLIHEAQRQTTTRVRAAGGVYTDTLVLSDAVPARLNPLATDDPMRNDQPASSRVYWLSLPAGTVVRAGDTWIVTGPDGEDDWTRTVLVQSVEFPRSEEVRRKALVTDTVTNP